MLRSLILVAILASCATPPAEDTVTIGQTLPEMAAPTGGMGSPCRTDADCGGGIVCDLSFLGGIGICIDLCTDDPDDATEAAACGADATCLATTIGGEGICTATCEASARPGQPGACSEHQVCTGYGLYRFGDTPGCMPFCHDDAACGPFESCDTRQGLCVARGTAVKPDGKLDGERCDPAAVDLRGRSTECLGECFSIGSGGVCGSLIDLARTSTCPDVPERIHRLVAPGDNLALCAFRSCSTSEECSDGMTCQKCLKGVGDCCTP